MRLYACVMLVAGCASPDPRLVGASLIAADKTHVVSSGPVTYELQFATSGLPMPEQLTFGGMNWIVGGASCAFESGVGINLYPAFRAIASTHGGDPPSTADPSSKIEVEMTGPAIARVRTHWAVDYQCEGHANTASGDLVLTLFPSGRIIRHDEHVIATSTSLTSAGGACGCGSSASYYLTSSWAFPDGAVNRDEHEALAGDNVGRACAMLGDMGIAVLWPDTHTRLHPNGANAFVYDWDRDASTIGTGEHALTTQMQLGMSSSCATLLAALATPALQVAGQAAPLGDDGIYALDGAQRGAFTIAAAATLPAGWALALHLDGAEHLKITGDGADGYIVQPDPGIGRTLIYFPQALAAGASLSVEAE